MFKSKRLFYMIISAALPVAVFITSLEAGSSRRRGTSGADELNIPLGARGLALSGAGVATMDGLEAFLWNPAGGSVSSGNVELIVSQIPWIAGIDLNYVGGAAKLGRNTAGISVRTLDFGDIPITTDYFPEGTGEFYSPRFMTFGFHFSRVMTDRIRFGFSLSVVSEQIMNETALGAALDAGVQYRTGENGLRIGAVLRNLGPQMRYSGTDLDVTTQPPGTEDGTIAENFRVTLSPFELPANLELGLGYPVALPMGRLMVSGSFLQSNFSYDEYRYGIEYTLPIGNYSASARFGGTVGVEPESQDFVTNKEDFLFGNSFGAGITGKVGGLRVAVDMAYRTTEYFDTGNWLSVTIGF